MKRAFAAGLLFISFLGVLCCAQFDLSGEWNTDLILDLGPGASWPDDVTVNSTLTIDYVVQDWTFSSFTEVENGNWKAQDFSAAGVLGSIDISSDVDFDVGNALLESWSVGWGLSLASVRFEFDATLTPGDITLDTSASATSGDIVLDVTISLGNPGEPGCDLDFQGVDIGVDFPFCCATVTGTLDFDCQGFNYAEFCVDELTIEFLPWLTLDICVKFEEQTKSFVISPAIDLGLIGCDFDLYYHLDPDADILEPGHGPLAIDGLYFDGLQIACEVGGIEFTGITYFGDSPPGLLSGTEYWEAYRIATTDDGCCGPFGFDVTVFFAANGTGLFDVAFFDANLAIELSPSFTFDMGLELDVESSAMGNWTFGFAVEF